MCVCDMWCVRLVDLDARGGRGLDRVRVNGVVLGGGGGGDRLLILLHLVVVLEVAILLLVILVVGSRVLLSGLGEVDDLAAGARGDNVVQIDGALGLALVLVIIILGCAMSMLDIWANRVSFVWLHGRGGRWTYHPQRPVNMFVSKLWSRV